MSNDYGRKKRKVQDLAVATAAVTHKESDLVLLRTQSEPNRRASPAKVTSQSVPCESVQRFEPERSHYFNGEPRLRLEQDFYSQPCISLAKAFLGKVLVRRCADGFELRGRIVETEAYLGGEDKASHSAGGKRTERNTAMFMKPGEGAAVLLRSLEPLQGQSAMRKLRAARRQEGARQLKDKELCNGPSKLCQALNIPRCFDRRDLASDPEVWLEADESPPKPQDIVSAPRIGIESHGEWAKKPWRFYFRGHPCVSVVNKEAERRSLSVNAADSSDP